LKTAVIFLSLFLYSIHAEAQCTTAGQTPVTAFPVCGVDTFIQNTVPACVNHSVVVPNCNSANANYTDVNPYWYTFTCYVSGTFGFVIIPNNSHDDYDWQLYDITNHNPNDIYTNGSLAIAGNWSGGHGNTGTNSTATSLFECASDSVVNVNPTFSSMPNIIQGHKYLLLVSHWTASNQSGYKLVFGGGTGSITDPNIPAIKNATIQCDHTAIKVKVNKNVRCNTLAPDGSDFSLSSPLASIVSATGINCNAGFDMDSVLLTLSNPLPQGNYVLSVKMGSDGNTLEDDCHNSIAVGDNVSFTALPIISAQFSYQVFYNCKYDSVQFKTQNPNGIIQWQWTFDNAFHAASQNPFFLDTIYGLNTVQLVVSNGVCYDTASDSFSLDNELKSLFSVTDQVCPNDKATLQNNSTGNIISWYWDFGDGTNSTDSLPQPHEFPPSLHNTTYLVKLIVKNNLGCYDTSVNQVTRLQSCYIDVPSGFTPNGDGFNDYLYPLNAYKAVNLEFRVFNRYGQLVFETKDWTKKWDGTINGKKQPTGVYVWMLQYTNSDTGKKYFLKGTTVLIR